MSLENSVGKGENSRDKKKRENLSRLGAFADENLISNQIMELFIRIRNIEEKENLSDQHFLLLSLSLSHNGLLRAIVVKFRTSDLEAKVQAELV